MGADIALALAAAGLRVRLWGRRASSLTAAAGRIRRAAGVLAAEGLLADDPERVASGICVSTELAGAVAGADLVLEAVAEDLAVKRALLRRAESLCPASAVLSSTTSALRAAELQAGLRRPSRFCIAHFAQPAHLVALVELVPGADTAPSTVDRLAAWLRRCGKTPVRCPDVPGFLWARIQHAVLREVAALVGRGLATPEDCDRVLRDGYAWRLPAMGAFEHADLAGLDLVCGEGARAVWADLSCEQDPKETFLGELLAEGRTGMRAGRGVYEWSTEAAEGFRAERDREILRRIRIRREQGGVGSRRRAGRRPMTGRPAGRDE